MQAINPEDTQAVQIHSVDNLVNEIRQLASKLNSSEARDSTVRPLAPETQAFRSPHDSQSQFFHPYKESVSRDPERLEDTIQSATKNPGVVTKGLSHLHSRLDEVLKNSNQIQRNPSQDNATTEPLSATSQELNVRRDATSNPISNADVPRPATLQLSSRSEVLEKYSQGPPSLSRMPAAPNAEAGFNNPFASARPSELREWKSPLNDTPNYKNNAFNNSPPINNGFQPSANVSTSNFFAQTTQASTSFSDPRVVDSLLSPGYSRPPVGFPTMPQETGLANPLGIRIEDQTNLPHSLQASKHIYDREKLDRIVSGIKHRGASPAPGFASINVGASERSSQARSLTSLGSVVSPTASQHSFQFPPSLEIPKLSHYGSVPHMRSDVFSPTNAFSQRNFNPQQYASYSAAIVQMPSPQNLIHSTAVHYPPQQFQQYSALNSNKSSVRNMPFTPSEGPLRTLYTNARSSLQYNERNYQTTPQDTGFHPEIYEEEDSQFQEIRQKPKKFVSGRKGTKRRLESRERQGDDALLENDDDSLVMPHFTDKHYSSRKLGNTRAPGGFGALEEDVSYISRPSIRETPQAQTSQLTQPSQTKHKSTRRERSRQRSAQRKEALRQVIPDSILGSGETPAIEESTVQGKVERPRRNSRKPTSETEPAEQPMCTSASAATVDKRDEFVPKTKKSTYTQGMELRRGGSSQKLKPEERRAKSPKMEHSSEFQFKEESAIKNTRLLAELERGLEISGSSEIKKNNQMEMLDNGETLSDFEFKGSKIEMVDTPEQRGRRREIEESQRDEDSVTRAFEHAKFERSDKKSPKKSPVRKVARETVAMKTEMVFKGNASRRKIMK